MADVPFPSSKFDTFFGTNPFRDTNPRHALWTKASPLAAEDCTRIQAHRAPLPRYVAQGRRSASAESMKSSRTVTSFTSGTSSERA